ncbi:hypothetical protein WH47_08019 [Habropoda laboriosa]|uniref:Apple domain-containing protein n=1 Tax=Habropoda laboriosa TaxID=597456 RepID=A0A0L7RF61_9HYME|nr:hypothetical protein WH47_08019 [Habropoda laboriosa]
MTRLITALLLVQAIARFGRVAAAESTHAADQPVPSAVPSGLSGPDYTGPSAGSDECDPEMVGFELVTGYVYTAPTNMLESIPGTLMLTDCLETCQANDSCQAVNYETGLCVLFSSNADSNPGALSQSQFPVFTIYAQKSCLAVKPCERAWCIDRVQGHRLQSHTRRTMNASSRQHCLELCLGERDFLCRWQVLERVTCGYGDSTMSACVVKNLKLEISGGSQAGPGRDLILSSLYRDMKGIPLSTPVTTFDTREAVTLRFLAVHADIVVGFPYLRETEDVL